MTCTLPVACCIALSRACLQPQLPGLQILVMERKAVQQRYLRTWFALDLAAAFPLDLLFAGKRLDIWRLPRLLKIIRVLKYKSLHHAGTGHAGCMHHSRGCLRCSERQEAVLTAHRVMLAFNVDFMLRGWVSSRG